MSSLKKQQHFVWKHYLKPWAKNDKIYCLGRGNIFNTSPNNIAQERFFYASEPLGEREFDFIKGFIKHLHPSAQSSQLELLKMYCETTQYDDYIKKCGIEDFHGIVEQKFKNILAKLYLKDLSFLKNVEDKNNFSFYVGCQYMRTAKMRENLINVNLQIPSDMNRESIARVFALLYSNLIGNWVFSKFKVSLLTNNTDLNFITSDQPIISTKTKITNEAKQVPNQFELYFPITPKLAIYISEELEENRTLDKNEVEYFNTMIFEHSKEQIYSIEALDLEQMKSKKKSITLQGSASS
ncbi:MAG: DUF4238 domain-containing protein [Bacteroidetes bacterium]|nr:DUF4238 domain-containing protein [Bacteroidota bacterium]